MKLFNHFFLFFLVPIFFNCAEKGNPAEYHTPLKTSDSEYIGLGDPFVYRHNGTYYMTGTSVPDRGFDYYTSKDLKNWEYKGALFRPSENHFGEGFFWAPEVKYYQGKFYLTYSSRDKESGFLLSALAVSGNPEGPFEELHAPWFNTGESAIDCHIFVDDDKETTPYLFFSQNGEQDGYSYGENYVVQLKKDLSGFEGDPILVGKADQKWEKVSYETNRCNEGVYALKHEGNYYMTYSANHTSYSHYGVGTARASHPLGPWIKDSDNPILSTDEKARISSPGHASIVESPDGKELVIVYHAHRDFDAPKPTDDRIVYTDKIFFNKEGDLRVKRR